MTGRISSCCLALVLALAIAGVASAQTRVEKQFDDWLVTCQQTEAATTCLMSETLSDAKTKQTVLSWIFSKGADGSMKAIVRTPVGVLLPEGLKIQIGGVDKPPVPYRFCGPRACTAELPVGDDWVASFRKEADFTVAFMTVAGQPISLKVGLKGFSAAYDYYLKQ